MKTLKTRYQAEAIGWAKITAIRTGKPWLVLQNICAGYYIAVLAEGSYSDEWLEEHDLVAFVYPPYAGKPCKVDMSTRPVYASHMALWPS